MPKNKRPVPRKSANTPEDKDEAVTRMLCTMALNLAEQDPSPRRIARIIADDVGMSGALLKLAKSPF